MKRKGLIFAAGALVVTVTVLIASRVGPIKSSSDDMVLARSTEPAGPESPASAIRVVTPPVDSQREVAPVSLAASGSQAERAAPAPDPLIAAGVVVDEAGTPIEGAWIVINTSGAGSVCQTNALGKFELRSKDQPVRLNLTVRRAGFMPYDSKPIEPGQTDLELRLTTACGVLAHFRLPPGTKGSEFGITVRQTDCADNAVPASVFGFVRDDHAFEWVGFPPGTYALSVSSAKASEAVLARVENILLRSGKTTDIGSIDLSDPSRVLTLQVVDPEGAPLTSGIYAFGARDAKLIDSLWREEESGKISQGTLRIPSSTQPIALAIAARGLRTALFTDVHDGDVLRMKPGIPITMKISNAVQSPREGAHLRVALMRIGFEQLAPSFTSDDSNESEFDVSRGAELLVPEPGRYALRWTLQERRAFVGKRRLQSNEPQIIEVLDATAPQHFDVVCPIDPATGLSQN